MQTVNGEELGVMIADIGPDEAIAEKAVARLREMGVSVEEEKKEAN